MGQGSLASAELLQRAIAGGRVHSAYLLSGPGEAPAASAISFARALVCTGAPEARPCGQCRNCTRSDEAEPLAIDPTGRAGPLFRHIGDHPDLFFVDRGEGTRVRIGQIRALQAALRLAPNEGGWRAAIVADAEWLNQESQNALLRLLEEPPDRTCIVLVTKSASGLLATIRSRCQRVRFSPEATPPLRSAEVDDDVRGIVTRLDAIGASSLPDVLDWAEEYRGARAPAAERVQQLLATGARWLRERIGHTIETGRHDVRAECDAFRSLSSCRKDLAQRNANPQMVAERALLAIRNVSLR